MKEINPSFEYSTNLPTLINTIPTAEVDHIIPKKELNSTCCPSGTNKYSNVQVIQLNVNRSKQNRCPYEYNDPRSGNKYSY